MSLVDVGSGKPSKPFSVGDTTALSYCLYQPIASSWHTALYDDVPSAASAASAASGSDKKTSQAKASEALRKSALVVAWCHDGTLTVTDLLGKSTELEADPSSEYAPPRGLMQSFSFNELTGTLAVCHSAGGFGMSTFLFFLFSFFVSLLI